MSGIIVTVDSQAINETLGRLAQRTSTMRPVFSEIGEYVVRQTQLRFDRQQAPNGESWQRLAPSTIKQKNRQNKISKILQRDGDLRRSIIYQATDQGVEIGTNRQYAPIHQFGGTIQRKGGKRSLNFKVNTKTGRSRFARAKQANFQQDVDVRPYTIAIPKREYLGISTEDETAIVQIVEDNLT